MTMMTTMNAAVVFLSLFFAFDCCSFGFKRIPMRKKKRMREKHAGTTDNIYFICTYSVCVCASVCMHINAMRSSLLTKLNRYPTIVFELNAWFMLMYFNIHILLSSTAKFLENMEHIDDSLNLLLRVGWKTWKTDSINAHMHTNTFIIAENICNKVIISFAYSRLQWDD